jgi:hypothetical protein
MFEWLRQIFRQSDDDERQRFVEMIEKSWGSMPIGNENTSTMFACGTGRGDGTYDVNCGFAGDAPVLVTIPFIEDDEWR